MLTEAQIAAIAYAIALMEGTAGGYSPKEKAKAKEELIKLQREQIQKWVESKRG